MRNMIKKFVRNEDGVTLIEYGLIAALIAVALIVALEGLEGNLSGLFDTIGGNL